MPVYIPGTGHKCLTVEETRQLINDALVQAGIPGLTGPDSNKPVKIASWTAGTMLDGVTTGFYYDLEHYKNRNAVVIHLWQSGVGMIPYSAAEDHPADPLNKKRIWMIPNDPGANNIEIIYT